MLIDALIGLACLSLISLSILLAYYLIGFAYCTLSADVEIRADKIAILIPFKNESGIQSQAVFLKSELSGTSVQVFWADDFSQSISSEFLEEIENHRNFNLIKRSKGKPGKKGTVLFGLENMEAEWVLLMDADSRPNLSFIQNGGIPANKKWRMIVLPVIPTRSRKKVRNFFDLEFLVLQFVTHSAAMLKMPLLSNGAALMVKRIDYLNTINSRSDFNISSGDDVFSLFAFQSKYGRNSIGSAVKTISPVSVEFPKRFKSLWNQRVRWISKTSQVPNNWFLFVSFLVLIANFSFAFLGFLIISRNFDLYILISVIAYLSTSFLFVFIAIKYWKRMELTGYIIPSILAYPFYLVALLVTSVISKPKWK